MHDIPHVAEGVDRAFIANTTLTVGSIYSKILGPTSRFDAGGFATSYGFAVEVGAEDQVFVVYETSESAVMTLSAGGLLPTNLPQLTFEQLDEQLEPVATTLLT